MGFVFSVIPKLSGFALTLKVCLDVKEVQNLEVSENNFKKLVLPDGHSEIVESLVRTHLDTVTQDRAKHVNRTQHFDVVRGKGRGLIILLHGAPGVGKTSMAESIAELTQRPLFPITCGDIGESAAAVQENLEENFHLAHRWNCVLLLDEADVFLAKRDNNNLARNAQVSVFLRVLEYYPGILFLTTNRVGAFDEAFKSRIHMSLYFPPLDRASTIEVWRMNLNEAKKRNTHLHADSKRIMKFAKQHYGDPNKRQDGRWNGRQIRNAFQTAIALAVWEAKNSAPEDSNNIDQSPKQVYLKRKHFKQVAKASYQFDDYLRRVLKFDDAGLAQNNLLRADGWQPQSGIFSGDTQPAQMQRPWMPLPSKQKVSGRAIADSDDDKGSGQSSTDHDKKAKQKKKNQKKPKAAAKDSDDSDDYERRRRDKKKQASKSSMRDSTSEPSSSDDSDESD